jgi:hypothetical protein
MGVTHLMVNAVQLVFQADFPACLPRDLAASPALAGFWQSHLELLLDYRHKPQAQPAWLLVYALRTSPRRPAPPLPNPILDAAKLIQERDGASPVP